jgi:putative transposase
MLRKARILIPNCPHHIVQRGHNRKALFVSDEDKQYYLSNLKEWKENLQIKLLAWSLMTNHIHLIVEPPKETGTVSELMKRINSRQTAYVNRLEGRSGSFWEGRFKTSPIQTENYLLRCYRYVELNPVQAGMVSLLEEYAWSSYQSRQNILNDHMLDNHSVYLSLGSDNADRAKHYQAFVRQGIGSREADFIRDSIKRNQLTGKDRFIDEIEQRTGFRVERRSPGRPQL